MKATHTKILFIILILGFSSCFDDFLERPLQGELTSDAFPETAEDALLATNAIYNSLRNWHYNFGGFPITDIMSDDAHKGSNPTDGAPTVGPYEDFSHTPTQDGLDRWWNTLYEGIKRSNVVIELVPEINMNETSRARYIAEAKFLRALFYFDLVRAWGGVPLITKVTPIPIQEVERASASVVYDFIETDLLDAIPVLPEQTSLQPGQYGRATKGAARALLGKMYLFRGDFANAEIYLMEVINSGVYGLDESFGNTHSVAGEFNTESVFEIAAIQLEGTNNGGSQWGNVQGVRGTPNRGWGFNRPSLDLINSFEPDDPRLQATVIFLGDVIDGVEILGDPQTPDETLDGDGNVIQIECYNRKVWIPGANVQTQWGHNRRLIRYADVLLMAAEALTENGKINMALDYLNEVRERARGGNDSILPNITETDPQTLLNLIMLERRHELALEGHRFWDLVRTGRATQVLMALGFEPGKHELFPIPQMEIDLTEGNMEQNPNWN